MTQFTLVSGDIEYLSFTLKNEDTTTGSISFMDLSQASTITLRMRKYDSTINTISAICSTIANPSATSGYCRALVTIPTELTVCSYFSEIEVKTQTEIITWIGNVYTIVPSLG